MSSSHGLQRASPNITSAAIDTYTVKVLGQGTGLVFGLVTIFLLERQVLSGLAYLSKKVSSIGMSGDLSAPERAAACAICQYRLQSLAQTFSLIAC